LAKFKIPKLSRGKHNSTNKISDKYYLKLAFGTEYDRNNPKIEEIIQTISTEERENGEPYTLADTLPDMSFKQADVFLRTVQNEMALMGENVTFRGIETVEINEETNTPSTEDNVQVSPLVIDVHFQNITKNIVDEIFRSEKYADFPYADKQEYAILLLGQYQSSVGVIDGAYVAAIPSEEEMNAGVFSTDVPIFSTTVVPTQNVEEEYNDNFEEELAPDEEVSEEIVEEPVEEIDYYNEPEIVEEPVQEIDYYNEPVQEVEPIDYYNEPVQEVEEIDYYSDSEPVVEEEQPKVVYPRFDFENIQPVASYESGYVQFKLNERKQEFNRQLEISEQNANQTLIAKIKNQRSNEFRNADELLDTVIKNNDTREKVEPTVRETVAQRLANEKKENEIRIKHQKQVDLAQAKAEYERKIAEIEKSSSEELVEVNSALEEKYVGIANQELHDGQLQAAADLERITLDHRAEYLETAEKNIADFTEQEIASKETNATECFDNMKKSLARYENDLVKQHAKAVLLYNTNNSIEHENGKYQEVLNENRQHDEEIQRLRDEFARERQEMREILSEREREENRLRETIQDLQSQVAYLPDEKVGMVSKTIEEQPEIEEVTTEPVPQSTPKQSYKHAEKAPLGKRALVGIAAILALGLGGLGYGVHSIGSQESEHNLHHEQTLYKIDNKVDDLGQKITDTDEKAQTAFNKATVVEENSKKSSKQNKSDLEKLKTATEKARQETENARQATEKLKQENLSR
jgi:hypothetical protein